MTADTFDSPGTEDLPLTDDAEAVIATLVRLQRHTRICSILAGGALAVDAVKFTRRRNVKNAWILAGSACLVLGALCRERETMAECAGRLSELGADAGQCEDCGYPGSAS
jgi:hypothetical protein